MTTTPLRLRLQQAAAGAARRVRPVVVVPAADGAAWQQAASANRQVQALSAAHQSAGRRWAGQLPRRVLRKPQPTRRRRVHRFHKAR